MPVPFLTCQFEPDCRNYHQILSPIGSNVYCERLESVNNGHITFKPIYIIHKGAIKTYTEVVIIASVIEMALSYLLTLFHRSFLYSHFVEVS